MTLSTIIRRTINTRAQVALRNEHNASRRTHVPPHLPLSVTVLSPLEAQLTRQGIQLPNRPATSIVARTPSVVARNFGEKCECDFESACKRNYRPSHLSPHTMSDRRDQVTGSQGVQLCANGCGFFGFVADVWLLLPLCPPLTDCVFYCRNPTTANMCSKCFKATHGGPPSPPMTASAAPTAVVTPAPLAAAAPVTPEPSRDQVGASATADATASAAAAMATPNSVVDTPATKKKKSKRKRCHHCKKRVGLTGFECRCTFVFCDTHRYADVHNCEFDYAADHRSLLEKANPRVVAAKIDRL